MSTDPSQPINDVFAAFKRKLALKQQGDRAFARGAFHSFTASEEDFLPTEVPAWLEQVFASTRRLRNRYGNWWKLVLDAYSEHPDELVLVQRPLALFDGRHLTISETGAILAAIHTVFTDEWPVDSGEVHQEYHNWFERLCGVVRDRYGTDYAQEEQKIFGVMVDDLECHLRGPTPQHVQDSTGDVPQPSLDNSDMAILVALSKATTVLMFIPDVAEACSPRLSPRNVGVRIARLIDLGLVERPAGKKKGCQITQNGRKTLSGNELDQPAS